MHSAKIDELLQCNICTETYDDEAHSPVTLPCGHSYCRNCLLIKFCPYAYTLLLLIIIIISMPR